MADGLDTSAYPPMGPELVAPVVGWLAHENCSITGESLIAIAGRVARVVMAETPGVYRPAWSMEAVADHIDEIRDPAGQVVFPVVPSGFDQWFPCALLRDARGRLTVPGNGSVGSAGAVLSIRLTATGALDPSFGAAA